MTHYMTLPKYPLIYKLPYQGTKNHDNDNLPHTTPENQRLRYDTYYAGVERGIIIP